MNYCNHRERKLKSAVRNNLFVLSKSTWASLKLHIFKRIAKLKSFTFPTDCVTAFIVAPLSKKLMHSKHFISFWMKFKVELTVLPVGLSFWSSCFLPLCNCFFQQTFVTSSACGYIRH